MELSQFLQVTVVIISCLLVARVWCEEEQHASELGDKLQPQKRSVGDMTEAEVAYPAAYLADDEDMDKRSSLLRFGKRGSLFRFGKRGSLFRFGKRGSLLRFGKRGSLFRFGKRDGDMESEQEWEMYPDAYLSDDDLKRTVKSFHWGRETEE